MAYTLWMESPVFDNRDCIRGTRTRELTDFGAFETHEYACCKAHRLYDEFRLDLGDGDTIHVFKDGKPLPRERRADANVAWELPF